ncbi:MAG: beta-galactosidase trimerization domain-containing protein [Candidatus Latescibacteria bacterium]|nr:beta-galactosidase trimerization domain-containing protein [Candidatus Latescibacterota bacterium]
MWDTDVSPVQGAVFSLLENHFGVDILDEWALLPHLSEFPVVVAPEQHAMSDEMVEALKDYVERGGKLLISGAESFDRFGESFLGVTNGRLVGPGMARRPFSAIHGGWSRPGLPNPSVRSGLPRFSTTGCFPTLPPQSIRSARAR